MSVLKVALLLCALTVFASFQNPIHAKEAPGLKGTPDEVLRTRALVFFKPLPEQMPGSSQDSPEKVALGQKLYFEKALSLDQSQNCNTCHRIDNGLAGTDYDQTSLGAMGERGPRNSPTVLNAGFQTAQFWDGRAADLVEQAKGPILADVEMAMPDPNLVVERLKGKEAYRQEFRNAFPEATEPITFDHVAQAIAAFERTLISPGRIDAFLEGDLQAITAGEKEGLEIFMRTGCTQCHNGPVFGGLSFRKAGVYHPYTDADDAGRFKVTAREEDRNVYKVPMLRNITLTAPYFHDGEVATLGEAVDHMAWMQLDRRLTSEEEVAILKFLNTLSDVERTSAPAPAETGGGWQQSAPDPGSASQAGEEIRYGYEILNETPVFLGTAGDCFVGNRLSCRNCHQEVGTKPYGIPWVGVPQRFPQFRGREGKTGTLPERINGCMVRSMNGREIPEDGREMKAMIAYMDWLSRSASGEIEGQGTGKLQNVPDRRADLGSGALVYMAQCQGCHGSDGNGYIRDSGETGRMVLIPALWGENSYNIGAGMNRLLTAAPFIRNNMPLGTPHSRPALSEEQAYDVAAYVNSHGRPTMDEENLRDDYPDLTKKPVDCPYPPYADDFPQDQHKYGPFQPIKDYYRQIGKKD